MRIVGSDGAWLSVSAIVPLSSDLVIVRCTCGAAGVVAGLLLLYVSRVVFFECSIFPKRNSVEYSPRPRRNCATALWFGSMPLRVL